MAKETETTTGKAALPQPGTVMDRLNLPRTTEVGSAAREAGKAYYDGIVELGRMLGGYGREFANETTAHGRALLKAKSLREAGALHLTFLQHRVDTTATTTQELTLTARESAKSVLAPFTVLTKGKAA